MPLKKLFKICSFILLFSGCFKPEKPKTEVCVLDATSSEGICGMSGGGADTQITRKPLSQIDKSTMFPPSSWNIYKNYVDELEAYTAYLERNCK